MTISTNTELGVSCTLELNYENVVLIHKLFNSGYFRRYIRGITDSSSEEGNLDYDNDYGNSKFDVSILDELIGLKDAEEFKLKAAEVAEINQITDEYSYHAAYYYLVRKTKKYRNEEIKEQKSQEHDYDDDKSYEKFNLNKHVLTFHFLYRFIELNTQIYHKDYHTSYSEECSCKHLLKNIQTGVDRFKECGIDEEEITISQYLVTE